MCIKESYSRLSDPPLDQPRSIGTDKGFWSMKRKGRVSQTEYKRITYFNFQDYAKIYFWNLLRRKWNPPRRRCCIGEVQKSAHHCSQHLDVSWFPQNARHFCVLHQSELCGKKARKRGEKERQLQKEYLPSMYSCEQRLEQRSIYIYINNIKIYNRILKKEWKNNDNRIVTCSGTADCAAGSDMVKAATVFATAGDNVGSGSTSPRVYST